MKSFESLIKKKDISEYTEQEQKLVRNVGVKSMLVIVYTLFILYGLFVPAIFIYCLLTLILSIIFGIIIYIAGTNTIALETRIWIVRIDAILTMLIWLSPLLKVIESIQ
jgi:hypothetical protein